MSKSNSLQETWEDAPVDPDPETDLGYEHQPLTVIRTDEKRERFIFLPPEEDHLLDSEFIIAPPGSVTRLEDCR
jgi:hypothetical protein